MRWTRQSVRHYDGKVVPGEDPMGRKHFWFVVTPIEQAEEGTDRWAIEQDYVSMTPLRLDLTNEAELADTQARYPLKGLSRLKRHCGRTSAPRTWRGPSSSIQPNRTACAGRRGISEDPNRLSIKRLEFGPPSVHRETPGVEVPVRVSVSAEHEFELIETELTAVGVNRDHF